VLLLEGGGVVEGGDGAGVPDVPEGVEEDLRWIGAVLVEGLARAHI
jgi:hypothetical protein